MPALVVFNRRWRIGSDDLVVPSFVEFVVRLAWLVVISIVFSLHRDAFDCAGGPLLHVFYIGTLTLISIHEVLLMIIMYISLQGTIIDTRPRHHMPKMVYTKALLHLPEVAWICMGTYWAFDDSVDCDVDVTNTVKVLVVTVWVCLFLELVGLIVVFDPFGGNSHVVSNPSTPRDLEEGDTETVMHQAGSRFKKMWQMRCKYLCCCCVGCDEHSQNAFSDVGQLFAEFFSEEVDLTPTDIAAGFILLKEEQDSRPKTLRSIAQRSQPTSTSTSIPPQVPEGGATSQRLENNGIKPWMNIQALAHYMKFAQAAYGWPLFMFGHLVTGPCRLYKECRCCTCPSPPEHIRNDNFCACHTAAILKTSQVDYEDIVFISLHNKIYEIPFFVALDHKGQSVVVAIRGTLSLRDVMTDLTAECDTIEIDGVSGALGHKGMIQAACYVKRKLERDRILDIAFHRGQGYKLVITGHSLGAGAAAILSILLKPQYPDLMCYAYSPPGGLLCQSTAKFTEDFVCSVVLNEDIVPRLGIVTMEKLKVKVLKIIKDCNKPKHKIMTGACTNVICAVTRDNSDDGSTTSLLSSSSRDSPRYDSIVTHFQESLQSAIVNSGQSRVTNQRLWPPGKIFYIEEADKSSSWCGTPSYLPHWAEMEDFSDIIVSPSMIMDHMPDAVSKALDILAERNQMPSICSGTSVVRTQPNSSDGDATC
ncbi:unnamed protein product [Owenia fusiformis]|uniref:sn-1-specific diacylglycerol lipase n=1 Tax=Owenia fusiformis TaxID=6347 RepID=A0A8S4PTV8_OWEFU|nr:unnamed protein product [Owenia fusiformis]